MASPQIQLRPKLLPANDKEECQPKKVLYVIFYGALRTINNFQNLTVSKCSDQVTSDQDLYQRHMLLDTPIV